MKKITLFFALFSFCLMHAQWTTDTTVNTLCSTSSNSTGSDMLSATATDGKTYVVWWKQVEAPKNYELRMQVLDVNGNETLGTDGILIDGSIPMGTYTTVWDIALDASNNIVVAVNATADESGHYYKLNESGTHLWSSTGIIESSCYFPSILPLSTGETVIAWWDGNTGQSKFQKYSALGAPVWSSIQQVVGPSSFYKIPSSLYEMPNGDFTLIFHIKIGSFGISTHMYAQRYNTAGTPLWAAPTQLNDQGTVLNDLSYTGAQDGDVLYLGYYQSPSSRFDSYLQRIDPDGTLPWGINGIDFDISQANFEGPTSIAFQPGSQYVWAVCTCSDSAQGQYGEYVQKFDKTTGSVQLTDSAKVVYAIGTSNIHSSNLQTVNDQPFFLIKSGYDNGVTPTSLNACLLDANGDFVWPTQTKPVATFSANKANVSFNKIVNNQTVTAFTENKGGGEKIYAQNFIDTTMSTNTLVKTNGISFVNPISNELKITSLDAIKTLKIATILGQEIYNNSNVNATEFNFNSSSWNVGVYLVSIKLNSNEEKVIKIIKN